MSKEILLSNEIVLLDSSETISLPVESYVAQVSLDRLGVVSGSTISSSVQKSKSSEKSKV